MRTSPTFLTHTPPDLEELLAAQAVLAKAFQSVFGVEPSADQLAALGSPAVRTAFRLMRLDEGVAEPDTRAFFARTDERTDKAVEHLRVKYTRLFIGPARLPAPPWESVYRGEERLLLQSSTLEVRALYRSQGALPARYPAVADDHVALELGFLHLVSTRAHEALANGAEPGFPALSSLAADADRIVNGHLLAWLPRFSDVLSCDDPHGYYAVSARLLVRFVQACSRFTEGARTAQDGATRPTAEH